MNREIRILFLLIDSRRGIMPIDQEIIEFLELNNINFYIVFTKNDLVKKPIILDNSKTINTSIRLNQGFDIIRNYIIKA
jgi:GTP-binding protein EngB required for normal cell division